MHIFISNDAYRTLTSGSHMHNYLLMLLLIIGHCHHK